MACLRFVRSAALTIVFGSPEVGSTVSTVDLDAFTDIARAYDGQRPTVDGWRWVTSPGWTSPSSQASLPRATPLPQGSQVLREGLAGCGKHVKPVSAL